MESEKDVGKELETLKQACLVSVMKELKKRLRGRGIKEVEAKDLLAVLERVGKLASGEGGSGNDMGGTGENEEFILVRRMSDETRKRIYEAVLGNDEDAAADAAE